MKLTIITSLLFVSFLSFGQRLQTPTLSPISKISQQVGLTKISLEYSRPSAKGRTVFGELVPYDQIWRTGANASTKITFEEAVYIGGKSLNAGTYALYTIPGKEIWTVIVHSNLKLRSLAGEAYKEENDVFRFQVPSMNTSEYVESFTMQFGNIKADKLDVLLSWENTTIAIPITVEVDSKVTAQMNDFLKEPEKIPHRTYFSAAQYYLTNGKDLNTAEEWIDAALKKSENNFRYGLLKAKIQHRNGNITAAKATIEKAYEWAKKAGNSNYIEQTSLFKKSIEN